MSKVCAYCRHAKDESEFNKNRTMSDGLSHHCKACSARFCREYRNRRSPTRRSWESMRKRCARTHIKHKYYYDRGIHVCDHWKDFNNFLADMGEKPTPAHELDRIDGDGIYEPKNCRWVTRTENVRNSSATKISIKEAREIRRLYAGGMTQGGVASLFGISRKTVSQITSNKIWREEDATQTHDMEDKC